jgi:hypothetical protein
MARFYTVGLVLIVLAVALATLSPGRGQEAADEESKTEVNRGFAIAPVRLNLQGKNRTLVGLGSYIVNAQADCSGCHTTPSYVPGFDPFRGQMEKINAKNYLAGGQSFGPFVSRNLTPEANGRPAGLTFEQFRVVIRTGHDLDKAHPQISPLLQVMPWPAYRKMTDHDLRAIYEYLRAIPSAKPGKQAAASSE